MIGGRFSRRQHLALALASALLSATACLPTARTAVSLRVHRAEGTPHDAQVTIDEQYIGPLYYVARHGVRLPTGEHRITVEKEGYFPWDALVVADREPITLEVKLRPIPD
jgi:hypothetical protein